MSNKTELFFAEVTDTYGGEANYSWVRRYSIRAKSMRGAAIKLNRAEGYGFRLESDYGDSRRYRAPNCCICAFISYDDYRILSDNHNVTSL